MHLQARAHNEGQIRLSDEVLPAVEQLRERLAEKNNVRLHKANALTLAPYAAGYLCAGNVLAHEVGREGRLAVDAALIGEAAMGFDDEVGGNAGSTLETVDVLGVELVQQTLLGKQADEDMRDGGVEVARVEVLGQHVKGLGVMAEEAEIKNGFRLWQVQLGEVGVEAGFWRAEVGNWRDDEFWSEQRGT